MSRLTQTQFAEEVARSEDGRTILFRVSRELAELAGDKFYDPVRFRFVKRDDGTYEMECQRAD